MPRTALLNTQEAKLSHLVAELLEGNAFYRPRLQAAGLTEASSVEDYLSRMPLTTKQQIAEDVSAYPPYGTNLTYPLEQYSRLCQSSGTASGPLPTLDTKESWEALLDVWDQVYAAAGVATNAPIFFAFSFGPFLGFWTAFEAATRRGNIAIPGGGLSSLARLQTMARYRATVLCCTPTYAIRLGEVLASQDAALRDQIRIQKILVAGEPGGSIPATREHIESLWPGAQVWDHHGMTEVGPVTYESTAQRFSLMVVEESFIAEVINPKTLREVPEGSEGELVLTTLDRVARPLLRYRTGDLVRKTYHEDTLCLEGGILGRIDDMVVIRGVNVYPSALEKVIREFPEVAEFQVDLWQKEFMAELEVQIEPREEKYMSGDLADRIEVALGNAFALRIPVRLVSPDSLPRYEFKSKRWIKHERPPH